MNAAILETKPALCSVCKKPLPKRRWLAAAFGPITCSKKSCKMEQEARWGLVCCNKARYFHCVCARSYRCPVHGERHVGTHD